ncbi:DUF4124 domain-containing protein [Geomonas sp. Red69]|uniref:DUF4124 domain-containing protein n=1 Tax=Geomonas diazotrophica TaxID=2843197 RepID=A0ABX8JJ79_9BACT|nr:MULTISPECIES: DUF4124 domain-containing protein [Geomonas]MBU5636834.1 DUF4124 domain-containing protein [Geomonas diazotrophica]QWV98358.1 DUF4124 domain-containing protein [Geomonas nitrogeniifigens]QXE87540.1 DUF4124 domain-containing protein [Geomonas nitrogeniifigens]
MNKSLLFLLLGALIICALPSRLLADYYSYTDNRGTVHMTNKLQAVPAKYRSTMKVTREDPKKQPAGQAPDASQAAPESPSAQQEAPAAPPGRFAQLTARHLWLKPLLVVAAIAALFVGVGKLASWLSSPMLSRVIYISFFVGVMVFLYKSYVDYMVESSMKIKERAVSMMKKASNRELPGPAAGEPAEPQAVPMPASDSMNRQ